MCGESLFVDSDIEVSRLDGINQAGISGTTLSRLSSSSSSIAVLVSSLIRVIVPTS
ncbi:unnamed protein product, partial [Rotaria sordida]